MHIKFYMWNICLPALWLFGLFITGSLATDQYGENWGVTRINASRVTYLWTISNYSLNDMQAGEWLESPVFSGDDRSQWQLTWNPKGYNNNSKHTSHYLYSKNEFRVKADCQSFIIDSNGEKTNGHSISATYESPSVGWGYREFILQSELEDKTKNLLPNDTLTIFVDIIVKDGTTSSISGKCRFTNNVPTSNEHTAKLLENDFLSDVLLSVEDRLIKAHRAILVLHSSWILQKFTENPNLRIVRIENTTIAAVRTALRFMYTGKIENTETSIKELLALSNQLGIEELKLMCEEALCVSMKPNNATEVLMFARLHHAKNLEREASNYIAAHAPIVVDTPDFQAWEKSYPNPVYGILRALINKRKN